jgi:hypothetical protein
MELALLNFISRFKSSVLGDPRLILLGATAHEESIGKRPDSEDVPSEYPTSAYARIENESAIGLDAIGKMMDFKDMRSILEIFAEKLLMNLVYNSHEEDDALRVINSTLTIFQFYSSSSVSCRMLGSTSIMKKLISEGQNYEILQHPSQLKQLGEYY